MLRLIKTPCQLKKKKLVNLYKIYIFDFILEFEFNFKNHFNFGYLSIYL